MRERARKSNDKDYAHESVLVFMQNGYEFCRMGGVKRNPSKPNLISEACEIGNKLEYGISWDDGLRFASPILL
jgi:hypothetical protein